MESCRALHSLGTQGGHELGSSREVNQHAHHIAEGENQGPAGLQPRGDQTQGGMQSSYFNS